MLLGRLRITAEPYNDHLPFVPFRVEYWKVTVNLNAFGKERRLFRYNRYSRVANEIRRGIYAPHPWANCYDSRLWTG